MSKCPLCGHDDGLETCEVTGCHNIAEYEGWYRHLDPLLQTPTGLLSRIRVCHEHAPTLNGWKEFSISQGYNEKR